MRVRSLLRNPSVARLVDDPVPRDGLAPVLVGVGFLVSFAVPMAYHVRREWSRREVRAGPVG